MAIIDLFGTTVRPAAGVAFVWLFVHVSIDSSISAKISISICLGAYALHGILLILKRQWGYIGWMLLNLIAFPTYFFFFYRSIVFENRMTSTGEGERLISRDRKKVRPTQDSLTKLGTVGSIC